MPNPPNAPNSPDAPKPQPQGSIDEETLKRALAAFKKRHKLTKLDHESRLGASRPMTSGKKAEGMGIVPPTDFPREVWRALAASGRIKDMGGGFYTVV